MLSIVDVNCWNACFYWLHLKKLISQTRLHINFDCENELNTSRNSFFHQHCKQTIRKRHHFDCIAQMFSITIKLLMIMKFNCLKFVSTRSNVTRLNVTRLNVTRLLNKDIFFLFWIMFRIYKFQLIFIWSTLWYSFFSSIQIVIVLMIQFIFKFSFFNFCNDHHDSSIAI